jgi:hypothetical protein
MPIRDADTRTVTLVDLPLVKRLTDQAAILDSEIEYTRDISWPTGVLLSSILPTQRGLHTLVCRVEKQQVVGQFRIRDQQNAQMIYLAPALAPDIEDTAWLVALDAMAHEAGRYGANALVAEVDEDSALFETMRNAGFAVYCRQRIWRRQGQYLSIQRSLDLSEVRPQDEFALQSLFANTIPSMLHQIAMPGPDMAGWIYRDGSTIEAFLAVSEGKHGIYIKPYIRPGAIDLTPAIFDSAIRRMNRAHKLPVYVNVYRHQDWISSALEHLDFEPGPPQALMVKHLTARVQRAQYRHVRHALPVVALANPPGPHICNDVLVATELIT